MTPSRNARKGDLQGGRLVLACATLIIAALSLFYRLGDLTIQPFDEARLANNALEMSQTGLSLVTTFDGITDYWNTKPPLLIWLMSGLIHILGPDEFAVRLTSSIAALSTAVLLFAFFAAFLRKPLVGFVSVSVLFSASGYLLQQPTYQITGHSARSGDYDSLLTLWTTAYLLAGYLYVHGGPSKRTMWMILSASAMALAFMTKTIQGLIFLPPLLLYIALNQPCGQPVRSRNFYLSVVLALSVGISYYALRGQFDPGYLKKVVGNDLGRFVSTSDGHYGGPLWYFWQVATFPWLIPGLLIAGYLSWHGHGEERDLARFLGLISLFYVVAISASRTKLTWYAMPVYPLAAMLVAIGGCIAMERVAVQSLLSQPHMRNLDVGVCILVGIAVVLSNIFRIDATISRNANSLQDTYNIFLRSEKLKDSDVRSFTVVHPGVPGIFPEPSGHFAPTLFYVNKLRHEGRSITITRDSDVLQKGSDHVVACGNLARAVTERYAATAVAAEGECGLYRIRPRP